ncbi:hypothetical protein [endosymbiont GvMRE of Glomus versiforme]|uniref:hypothetical protein n=1 Tax=endosymbiont GvMRE of Glomus versiforme TaxID=2039283 RepID=UPI000ECFBC69|nr:hypothetical protein [endosymbiont GvMRE of Glomus versiforme]RHZ37493.1 hypothetical protein GvMRE_I1g561 [endosymbiont GvMRE of Glomus versiforme]
MENKELLFNLVKKLESGDISFEKHGNEYFFYQKGSNIPVKIGEIKFEEVNYNGYEKEDWNTKFKDNFYKEKGVKCWVKDCQNKILQVEADHKKVKIPCQESHSRMLCLNCADNLEVENE